MLESPIVISYTGAVAPLHDLTVFFRGLRRFAEDLSERPVRFDYYGPSRQRVIEVAQATGIQDLVSIKGNVDAHQARLAMTKSSVLLLLSVPGEPGIPGGKFYDYLASLTPILVVPSGDEYIADVLEWSGAGLEASNPIEISHALSILSERDVIDRQLTFKQRVERLGWPARTRSLATVLDVLPQAHQRLG